MGTGTATNQPPPLVGYDVAASDPSLTSALQRAGAPEIVEALAPLGTLAGAPETREHARSANAHPPELTAYDRYGNRIDEVRVHPSWHWLLGTAVSHGLASYPEAADADPHAHLRRAAGFYVWSQAESGNGCPVSMTYAALPALAADQALLEEWGPRLRSRAYDPGSHVPGTKRGCLAGMGMTEKQAGSDVRATLTVARPTEDGYLLSGHKWFTSAPMDDVFLMLAQAPDGLTCFVVPRVLPDGSRNGIRLTRLKDKLGNRSNASAEIELESAWAARLGDEGRGVATIIEMVAATRLDCVLGSAALMRRAVAEASWHVSHRAAFGRSLSDAPLMQRVVADLAIEAEAATALALRLADAADAGTDPDARALRRLALPLAKFWVCKRTPALVAEALECLGGNGYVEESGMPTLFRESPLNSIWEGAGNVNALDVLRAVTRAPECLDAWLGEVGAVRGQSVYLDAAVHDVLTRLADLGQAEGSARILASRMAVCLQGAILLSGGDPELADAFCGSRLGGDWAGVFGTLSTSQATVAAIAKRATPVS